MIRSTSNPRVKNLVRLRQRRHRRRQGHFIIEGGREIARAMKCGLSLAELYFAPEFFKDQAAPHRVDEARKGGARVWGLSPEAFSKVSYRQHPDGLLAVAPVWDTGIERIALSDRPLLLVAEGVEKPGNLGSLMRTADAAGIDAVVLTDAGADIFNPHVVRTSQGALFSVPVAVTEPEAAISWMRRHDIAVQVTSTAGKFAPWDIDFTAPSAIVVGSEKDGLSDAWIQATDMQIRIPMAGMSDSLNLSAAAAVVIYEAVRQRRGGGG